MIEKLNLKKCADTVVGSPGLVRGISGGERKRTNVALSLLGSPSLLLLDEPTSGLDSKMSDSLMRDVKQVTEQGCTVVATIHQPSEAVFTRFDKVLLLETGRATWLGSQLFFEISALSLKLASKRQARWRTMGSSLACGDLLVAWASHVLKARRFRRSFWMCWKCQRRRLCARLTRRSCKS